MTNIAAIKRKGVGKREANTKITLTCVIEEETEELGKKPLRHPPGKTPPSLFYLMHLSPPSFLL